MGIGKIPLSALMSNCSLAGIHTVDYEKILFVRAEPVERFGREFATKEGALKCQPYLF